MHVHWKEVNDMNKVVEILINRDCMTKTEAEKLIDETREELLAADPFEAEDIIANYLGLEPDYIMDILW